MTNRLKKNKKVCYILSYKDPGYIRTRVLLQALSEIPMVEVHTAINVSKSIRRYSQTLWRLIKTRIRYKPDVFILGFRGQEIYWPVRVLTLGKPLIFDEFINMHDWLGEENNKLPRFLIRLADLYERLALKFSQIVLTDTELGAKKSSTTYNISLEKFRTIYVGTDQEAFKLRTSTPKNKMLEVFFYGNMAPLHGMKIILSSAIEFRNKPVHFTIIGGKNKPHETKVIRQFIEENKLKNITHKEWIDFHSLPKQIAESDLFLAGPFGGTSQARRVITGKTFQALAVGTPVIIGNINEDVGFKDEYNCLLVEQGSVDALTEAVSWAMENRDKLTDIGENGRKLFERRFATKVIAARLLDILEKVSG